MASFPAIFLVITRQLYLASPIVQRWIMAEEYGATRQALTKQMILDFSIPLPPLNEQKRIVAVIEALRDRTQKAREALETIPALCDKFRQSVLAAAFRGDLTADWREQNPDVEPASVLLEKIRRDRHNQWEKVELCKLQTKGKVPIAVLTQLRETAIGTRLGKVKDLTVGDKFK